MNYEFQILNLRPRVFYSFLLLLIICFYLFAAIAVAAEKWQGVDESVVNKIAKEQGREAREPIISSGHGDLLLFAFLLAGTVGGFAAGYNWRKLTEKKRPDK